MSVAFEAVVAIVLAYEGGYMNDPSDPGNWTGSAVGVGECKGTNFGISAAAYPNLDIAALTREQAEQIYESRYWMPIQGDSLPPALALIVFDGAVNSGVSRSAKWFQAVLGVTADGIIGPETLAAADDWSADLNGLCGLVLAQRVYANGCDGNFSTFGLGWSNRTSALAFRAASLL